jgi:hypothetical protein
MFGSFSESALLAYADKVKKVVAKQGTEGNTNFGISDEDSSFIDTCESQDAGDYAEFYDFTTCIRSNGTLYGIAPGKKCRKGSETDSASKETRQQARLKAKVLKAIEADSTVTWAQKERGFRTNGIKKRQEFIKANRYPAANEGVRREVERLRKEIAELDQRIAREKRRIAAQVLEGERKVPRAERLGRMAATRARAEKVLADIRKENPKPVLSDTEWSGRNGVYNKSKWD